SGSAALTVTQIPVASITLAVTNANMRVGDVQAATAQARDANGSALTDRTITWASSNPAVASVTQAGVITAIAVGATAITASSGGQFATAALTVTPNVASIDLTLGQNPMIVGAQAQATATAKDAGGAVVPGASISFSSSNTSVATVSASGTVTAVTVGTTNIIATSGAITRSVALTVNPAAVPVATVTIAPNGGNLQIGQTLQLTATTLDGGGATLAGRIVTWTSSSPSVASVSSSGLVSGVAAGTSTITATSEGKSAQVSVTVALAPVATVTVSAPSTTVSVGNTMQASVVLTDANGLTLTRPVLWTSSNANVATVNASGLVTAVAAGAVTIFAQSEGKTGSIALTILGTPTLSIASVTPTNGATNQSIETFFVVTFSENINAATVNAASVALTANGAPVAASRTVSGKVLTITPTSLLPENTTVALVISTALKSAVGNTLPSAFNGSFGIALFDPNYYYRFFNNLTGQANSLDTFSNTFQGFMGVTGGFTGQFWYMSPVPGAPGYYLMRNLFKGDNWYLEGTDGISPVELQNTAPNIFTGQAWRFAPNAFGPGCFALQNLNFGATKSMANVSGSVKMQPTAVNGSQCWSIARIGHR
ncbi:MAG TPA: Ig-like domain-containing protein, partial [Gemmatimonadaceae bacterium]|nr:Ig-like domain-containing protein [Gemmatimonadaceae bacterium]